MRRPVPPDGIMRKGFLQNDCPTACTEPRCAGHAVWRAVPPDGIMRKGFLQNACILAIIRFTYFVPIKKERPDCLFLQDNRISLPFPALASRRVPVHFLPDTSSPRRNPLEHRRARLRPSSIMARVPGDEVEAQPPGPNDRSVPSAGRIQPRRNHLEHCRACLHPSSIMARVPGNVVKAQPPGPNDRRVPSPGHIQPRRTHLEHCRASCGPSSIMARVPGDEVEAQPPGPNDRRVPSPGRSQLISPCNQGCSCPLMRSRTSMSAKPRRFSPCQHFGSVASGSSAASWMPQIPS